MGSCILCGNEVKEAPYRESATLPKEEVLPPKVQQAKPRQPLNIVHRVALGIASVGGIILVMSTGFHLQMGVHLGLGTLVLGLTIPIAHLIFIRFPEAVGRLSRGAKKPHDGFFETEWDEGGFLIIAVPICLAVLGLMIYLMFGILIGLGHFINTLL